MKKIVIAIVVLLTISCKTKMNETNLKTSTFQCPEDGVFKLITHKGKSLDVKMDNFNQLYYQLSDNEKVTTYIYEYQKKTDTIYPDSYHTESLVFELENTIKTLDLKDENLKKIKLLKSRLKFERSENIGNHTVEKGTFTLKNKQVNITVDTEKEFLLKNVSFDISE